MKRLRLPLLLIALIGVSSEAEAQSNAGSWSGSINCSWGSGGLSLTIDASGNVSGTGTNLNVTSGSARGKSIAFETTNFFGNRAQFRGIISNGQAIGNYTQSTSSESCSWQASLVSAPEPIPSLAPSEPGLRRTALSKPGRAYHKLMGELRLIIEDQANRHIGAAIEKIDRMLEIKQEARKLDAAVKAEIRRGRWNEAQRSFPRIQELVAEWESLKR